MRLPVFIMGVCAGVLCVRLQRGDMKALDCKFYAPNIPSYSVSNLNKIGCHSVLLRQYIFLESWRNLLLTSCTFQVSDAGQTTACWHSCRTTSSPAVAAEAGIRKTSTGRGDRGPGGGASTSTWATTSPS